MANTDPRPSPHAPWMIPYLTVRDVAASVDFYVRAFGFEKGNQVPGEGGRIMHADIRWHGLTVMFGLEGETCKAPVTSGAQPPQGLYLYVEDVDVAFRRAIDAGCATIFDPADMFWGDRVGIVRDPDGYQWTLATNVHEFDPNKVPTGS